MLLDLGLVEIVLQLQRVLAQALFCFLALRNVSDHADQRFLVVQRQFGKGDSGREEVACLVPALDFLFAAEAL